MTSKKMPEPAAAEGYLPPGPIGWWDRTPGRQALELTAAIHARRHGLRVTWFPSWSRPLDEALEACPEMEHFDHALLSSLARNDSRTPKCHGLVEERGVPIAVLPLRRRKNFWEPVTTGCIPDVILPAARGRLGDALHAAGLYIHIAEVYEAPAPLRPDWIHTWDQHRADVKGDYEEHWKATNLWKNVRMSRNRTAHLEVRINRFEDIEWTIRRWGQQWLGNEEQLSLVVDDSVHVANMLDERGRTVVITLCEGGLPVAGITALQCGNVLHGLYATRAYGGESGHCNVRVLDLLFATARDKGLDILDIGGLSDYKRRWAPAMGTRSTVEFLPLPLRLQRDARRIASRVVHRVRRS